MYVQKCIKGVNGITYDQAAEIMMVQGLTCNWWRERVKTPGSGIGLEEIGKRLTRNNLYLHVNAYSTQHPVYPGRVSQETPFISLSAGNVTAPVFSRTSTVWPAHQTALAFAVGDENYEGDCFLFHCWVIVGLQSAVGVRALAEEVRELKTYSQYSFYQGEGEIAAKIDVPPSQIEKFEHWRKQGTGLNQEFDFVDEWVNPGVNSLLVSVLSEEEQSGNGRQHALVLVDRAAVSPSFLAEHAPCLHFCDGVLDGGADLAEACVEFALPAFQFPAFRLPERNDPDTIYTDVAEIRCGFIRVP